MFWRKMHKGIKKHMMTEIDILVLGNRGSGKTSLLATTLYNMNESLQSNGIIFEPADEETDKRLKNSISEIENMFTSKGSMEVGEGIAGTDGFIDYGFRMAFTDDSWNVESDFSIRFHDYAGSILANGDKDKQYEELKKWFLKSQIVYILIDTPYLMESTRKTIAEYSAKDEILRLFQKAGDEGADKLIAIVPTKCEYYLRNGRATDVRDRIRAEFNEILSYIGQINKKENREKYKLYITPVQTVGGLEFSRMENREGRQVASFRRTKPNSKFQPVNTDLLLLFCMDYLFDCMFLWTAVQVKPKIRKNAVESLSELDEEKILGRYMEEYVKCISNRDKRKEIETETEKEAGEIFKNALYAFFSEYDKRESIIEKICKAYEDVHNCYIIFKSKKKLEDNFRNQFQQHFTQIYL